MFIRPIISLLLKMMLMLSHTVLAMNSEDPCRLASCDYEHLPLHKETSPQLRSRVRLTSEVTENPNAISSSLIDFIIKKCFVSK